MISSLVMRIDHGGPSSPPLSSPSLAVHGHADSTHYPYAPYDYFSHKQTSAAASSVSLAGSVTFAVVAPHAQHDRVPPVPPLPAVHPAPAVVPASAPSSASFPGGPAGCPAGKVDAMAADKRPTWKRGTSMRASTRRVQKQPAYPQRITPTGRPDDLDGFVPYRPPFASRSTGSLSPVQPSGAQGIGLAPAPPPVQLLPPPPAEKPRKGLFGGWPFSGKRRKRSRSDATPSTLHPGASTASFGTTYAGGLVGGAAHAHSHSHSRSHSHLRLHQQPDLPHADPSSKYGPRFSAYAPKGRQFVAAESTNNPAIHPSPSVLTGLVAPKMLFSPLSRHLGTEGDGLNPRRFSSTSTPNLLTPTQTDTNGPTEHLSFAPDTRLYPRVGDNHAQHAHGVHSASWASLPGTRSSVTLHSEGSKSRLTVTTVCDALTFPRPRMNAHDITPPETPQQNATGAAMHGSVHRRSHGAGHETDDDDYDDDDITPVFSEAVANSRAREAEREEWAGMVSRRGRSSSLGRSRESLSMPSTPGGFRNRLHSVTSGSRKSVSAHGRSRSGSSSLGSFLGRNSQRARDRVQVNEEVRNASHSIHTHSEHAGSYSASHDSLHTPIGRSQSYRERGSRRGIGIFESLRKTPQQSPTIHKSTSSPQLSSDDHSAPRSPQRSQSMKYQSSTKGSTSNPDFGVDGNRTSYTALGSASSPRKLHRQTGPPRSFQFRLQSQPPRHLPVNGATNGTVAPSAIHTGVVVVGPSTTVTLARTPKAIDFADPYRTDRPPSPSPPPKVPTPDRGSPFSFNSDEIGVAITTAGNEAAAPPPMIEREHHQSSSNVSVLQPSPLPKEPPSSAHARYLLARQHRRSVTLRAFQSPAYTAARKPAVAPLAEVPPVLAPVPVTFVPLSPSSQGRTTPPPFASYPHRLDVKKTTPTSPRSPRSPVSPEGKARGISTLGPRAGPAGSRASRVRPRSVRSASSADSNPSESPKVKPALISPISSPVLAPAFIPTARPLRTDKDLPPVPTSPMPASASSSIPPSPRLPPPSAPPSRPIPPTPTSRPSSYDGSSQSHQHHRFASLAAFETSAGTAPAASSHSVTSTDRATTPTHQGLLGPGPSNVAPAPQLPRPVTPQAQVLPTIMDESPTPVRQTTVAVLSPPPSSPTPGAKHTARTRPGYPFTSIRPSRPHSVPSEDVFNSHRSMVPIRVPQTPSFNATWSHRSVPSVSAVIPSPELFRGPQEMPGQSATTDRHGQRQHSQVSPDLFSREFLASNQDIHDRSSSNLIVMGRSASGATMLTSPEASFALADNSGVLAPEPEEPPQRIPPLPRPGFASFEDMERLQRSSGSQSHSESRESRESHESHDATDATGTEETGGTTDADTADLAGTEDSASIMHSLRRATSDGSFYTTEAAGVDEWPRLAHATAAPGEEDSDTDHSETTLPDMFPQSDSSALSHYTDAEEGSAWSSPVDHTEPLHVPQALQIVEAEQELPEPRRSESASTSVSSGDPTPTGSVLTVSGPDAAKSKRLSTLSEQIESLTNTPRPAPSDTKKAVDDHGYESLNSPSRRRTSFSSGSVSSGSEVSVRHSLDENFRGLFYRTPHVPSPEQVTSALPRRRLPPTPRKRNGGHGHSSGTDSPEAAARNSDASGFEIRTPVVDPPASTFTPGTEQALPSTGSSGSLPPSLPAIPQGLGIMSASGGSLDFLSSFDSDVDVAPTPSRTPPVSVAPRDDSWITESYHRLSQVVARSASATPGRPLSLRKPRPYSADQAVPFSPTTFGVHTERFSDSPGPSTPRSHRRTTTSSGSSTADPLTPNPDVVDKFPTPPHRF